MRTATVLMCVGAGLTIVSAIVFFATTDQYARALAAGRVLGSQAEIDDAVSYAEGREIVRTVIQVGLWLWMAVKNWQGRPWARIVATVFGVINVAGFVLGLVLGSALLSGLDMQELLDYMLPQFVVGTASVALAIVILVQLYRPDSSRYFDESTRYKAAMTLRGYT